MRATLWYQTILDWFIVANITMRSIPLGYGFHNRRYVFIIIGPRGRLYIRIRQEMKEPSRNNWNEILRLRVRKITG